MILQGRKWQKECKKKAKNMKRRKKEKLKKIEMYSVPVAQWLEHCVSRLWVRFPGNTCTDKKMFNLIAL